MSFELSQIVRIVETQLTGTVYARTEHWEGHPNLYLVRYVNSQGDLCREWFSENDLIAF